MIGLLEQRKYPRRKIQMYATAQVLDIPPLALCAVNISRNGLCMHTALPEFDLSGMKSVRLESYADLLGQDIEVCFALHPVSAWGRIIRVARDGREYGVALARTSDDLLWRSICSP